MNAPISIPALFKEKKPTARSLLEQRLQETIDAKKQLEDDMERVGTSNMTLYMTYHYAWAGLDNQEKALSNLLDDSE